MTLWWICAIISVLSKNQILGVGTPAVCPHDADASVRVVVDSVCRTRIAVAEALVDDASRPLAALRVRFAQATRRLRRGCIFVLHEIGFELPPLEMLSCGFKPIAVDLALH